MDADTFYQQGVTAICEARDLPEAQRLLRQSLKLNPKNDMAWMWLSYTLPEASHKRRSLERALQINPQNKQAQELLRRIKIQTGTHPLLRATATIPIVAPSHPNGNGAAAETPTRPQAQTAPPRPHGGLSPAQKKSIQARMQRAEVALRHQDEVAAIENWAAVLKIKPDHETALRNAVRYLILLNYTDDAVELTARAIDSGTQKTGVYLLAMDLAIRTRDNRRLSILREELLSLGPHDEDLYLKIIEDYIVDAPSKRVALIIKQALEDCPESQRLLLAMGDLHQKMGQPDEAALYYDRAAKQGLRTDEGKTADKKLTESAPILTDAERGSVLLALREAAMFGVFFLALAWLDSGLNLLRMDALHWLGVILSIAGGYLLVTATSSPQQTPIAAQLGGVVPAHTGREKVIRRGVRGALQEVTELPILPGYVRGLFGVLGVVLLLLAFSLVFEASIDLLNNPVPPDWESQLNEAGLRFWE